MYEKLMYKVETKDNKELYRLQDFTKNDKVDISMFEEGQTSQGKTRLQCKVIVMHPEKLDALNKQLEQSNKDIKELNNKIMQKNVEIERLENEVAKLKRANVDERAQLSEDKFDILQEHKQELDKLNETHTNQLLAIDETHRQQLEKISAQYNARLDKANDKLDNEVQANKQASKDLQDEMLTMKETHKQEVISLQSEHHDEVEKLQHAHSNELQALQNKHEYDINELNEAINTMKQEHLVEVNEIETNHIHDIDDMRTKFLKLLANEHAQDLSDFNDCGDLPFYVRPFAKGFLKSFNEFKKRKELNTPQKIVETYELAQRHDE